MKIDTFNIVCSTAAEGPSEITNFRVNCGEIYD